MKMEAVRTSTVTGLLPNPIIPSRFEEKYQKVGRKVKFIVNVICMDLLINGPGNGRSKKWLMIVICEMNGESATA